MNDLIEKVKQGLKQHHAGICTEKYGTICPYWECEASCSKELMADAMSVIESLQLKVERLRDERRWVSVNKRLPRMRINPLTKDYDDVICLCKFGDDMDVRMYKFGGAHFYNGVMCVDEYVTHWMYKPQPPKEGDGE